MPDVLLVEMVFILFTALFLAGAVWFFVHGVQGIKHFGSNSRRGLCYWSFILAGLYMGYSTYTTFWGGRPLRAQTAAALVIGLVAGGLLSIVVRPRWTLSQPKPTGFEKWVLLLTWVLILATIAFIVPPLVRYHGPLTGGDFVLIGVTLLILILLLISRIYPEDSREQRS